MTSLASIRERLARHHEQKHKVEMEARQPVRELHLVRVEDSEFYFFEFEAALRKLYEIPQSTIERITVH
ncbi:MAG: hypothetical protein H6851_13145 [Geminicoccaceae bacterium]|nr:hypothetical protein [Geminicoccaceae bacterium]MCB9944549.1 hypothetical protein [Geminicoccaceae bacterium]